MANEKSIQNYKTMDMDAYIKHRVDEQMIWMDSKSTRNKKSYQRWKLLVILLSVSIPFLVTMIEDLPATKYIIGLAGVLIAGIEGILSLFSYQNNWINYRQTSDALKREKLLFLTQAGKYKSNASFHVFVENIEKILGAESQNWASYADDKVAVQGGDG